MSEVRIKICKDGPYEIKGPVKLIDANRNEYTLTDEAIYLCRCGQSQNRPFCDGSHKGCGFKSDVTAS